MEFNLFKIAVFVPKTHADIIRKYLADSGCGKQGYYDSCSFSSSGEGRFRALENANPFIKDNHANEEKIEVICDSKIVKDVVKGLVKVHPYEEPAIDIIPIVDYHSFL